MIKNGKKVCETINYTLSLPRNIKNNLNIKNLTISPLIWVRRNKTSKKSVE